MSSQGMKVEPVDDKAYCLAAVAVSVMDLYAGEAESYIDHAGTGQDAQPGGKVR